MPPHFLVPTCCSEYECKQGEISTEDSLSKTLIMSPSLLKFKVDTVLFVVKCKCNKYQVSIKETKIFYILFYIVFCYTIIIIGKHNKQFKRDLLFAPLN